MTSRARGSTSPVYRLARIARVAALLLEIVIGFALRSSGWTEQRRARQVGHWCRALLSILGVRVEHVGDPPAAGMLVMNHVSWLDIAVLNAVAPSRFVSKAEVAKWPLIGYASTQSGTLYIERGRKRAARDAHAAIAAALSAGQRVVVFPEGTTSYGDRVLHFHAALLQPVIDAAGQAYPVALRYTDREGRITRAPSYVGEQTLFGSLWALLGERRVVAHLTFLAPVAAKDMHRRELADALHAAVSRSLAAAD